MITVRKAFVDPPDSSLVLFSSEVVDKNSYFGTINFELSTLKDKHKTSELCDGNPQGLLSVVPILSEKITVRLKVSESSEQLICNTQSGRCNLLTASLDVSDFRVWKAVRSRDKNASIPSLVDIAANIRLFMKLLNLVTWTILFDLKDERWLTVVSLMHVMIARTSKCREMFRNRTRECKLNE